MLEDLLTRKANARARLVACLAETGGITEAQAEVVAAIYLKAKGVTLGTDGQFRMKHGALMDRVVIRANAGLED